MEHSNKDIDKAKTDENYFLSANDYSDMMTKAKALIKQTDEDYPPKRVNKDRVTLIQGNLTCPKELEQAGMADDFFRFSDNFFKERYGKFYVGMAVHKDEVHLYMDNVTHAYKESCFHGHFDIVPYAEWTDKTGERRGINGKNFMAKDSLKALQRDFNTAFRERYGMDYNTGETPKNQTVEQLKAEGAMELERHAKELKKTIKKQTAEISWNDSKISEQTAEIDGLELTAKEQKAKLKKLKARESELDDEIVQKTATVDNLTHAGDTAEKRLKQIAKAQKFYLEQVYPRLAEISTDTTKSAFARQLAAVKAKNVDEAKTPEDFMQAVHMAARSVHIEEPDYDDEEELDYER